MDSDEQAAEIERLAKEAKAKQPQSPGTEAFFGPMVTEVLRQRMLKEVQRTLYFEARLAGYG